MLSRPSAPSFDRLAKATLIATAASLLVGGGLTVARVTHDTCSVDTAGLDANARTLVARRALACRDYEAGRITKQDYRAMIAYIDFDFAPPAPKRVAPTMWADTVRGYSTQYSETSWSAQQALGAPDVFPNVGDRPQAWASLTADDQDEWLELGFSTPRAVSAVEIYETYNPGAVGTIELITTSGRRIALRRQDEAAEANKLVVSTSCTSEPIAAVRITIESKRTAGWNEIDAVGLVPCAPPPVANR